MTARSSQLGSFAYATESSFCENTTTFGTRMLPIETMDFTSLEHPKIDINPLKQRAHEGEQDIRVGFGGSFSASFILGGHGGTAASEITATDLAVLLGHFFGAVDSSTDGGTCDGGGTEGTFTTAGTIYTDGAFMRFGVPSDPRSKGQFTVANGDGTTTWAGRVGVPAVPSNTDLSYGCITVYPEENPGQSHDVQSIRVECLTANKVYRMHGVFPMSANIESINVGEVPRITLTWGVAYWNSSATTTFPSVVSTDMKVGAVVAQGSLFMAPVGTLARSGNVHNLRNWTFEVDVQVTPIIGPAGVFAHQTIVGATRISNRATASYTFDVPANGTETFKDIFDTDENTLTKYHILNSMSVEDGKAIAIYLSNATVVGGVPLQADVDGLNRITINFRADTNTTDTSTELTLSSWRLGLG